MRVAHEMCRHLYRGILVIDNSSLDRSTLVQGMRRNRRALDWYTAVHIVLSLVIVKTAHVRISITPTVMWVSDGCSTLANARRR